MSKVFTIAEGLENMGAIKTGGQGSVYKGRRKGEIITAIKLLPTPIFLQSEEDPHYRSFINEVEKLKWVSESPNPNVVKLLSHGINEASGFPFIEMEYIDGPDLAALLKPPYDPVFHIKEVVKLAEQLSKALAHCHKLGVKHGDIKPNNIRYNRQTGNFVLLDFGLAILSDEERRTSKQQAGAIEFMAPEQNEGTLLFETDVYSFGVVLYELLAGQVPFPLNGNSVTARNKVMLAHLETSPPDFLQLRGSVLPATWPAEKKAAEMQVPGWLVSTVYKCLQKNPKDRFADGVALHDFISERHIYATNTLPLAKEENRKQRDVVIEKEHEVQDLKAIIAKQESELKNLRQNTPVRDRKHTRRRATRRPWFYAALVALLLTGGLLVYGLFFRSAVAGSGPVAKGNNTKQKDTISNDAAQNTTVASENSSAAKDPATTGRKDKMPEAGKVPKKGTVKTGRIAAQTMPDSVVGERATSLAAEKENNSVPKTGNGGFDFFARYKVQGKAHFYTEPNESTKRPAFITHWNNAVLKPLDEQDGYVYVIFTNFRGETSRGWLAKADLIKVK